MSQSTVSYIWREPRAAASFQAGVSLHSHTSHSRETLDFIAELTTDFPLLTRLIKLAEDKCERTFGVRPKYKESFWTPPLKPRLAFELERSQIENAAQLPGMVSISDHDDISANVLLRALPSARHIPISTEWSVPYQNKSAVPNCKYTAFHIGVHNLPPDSAAAWNARLNEFSNMDLDTRPAHLLGELLADLDSIPGVLIIFNHPLWDLYRLGRDKHDALANDFLAAYGQYLHALELNGLRDWTENRRVQTLARQWNMLVISGGDRHGLEPNANINLTRATDFAGFVHEVRKERRSDVLFMEQYRQPWKHRILQSTLDAIRNHPNFPEGSRRWDERVFHPNREGQLCSLAELWPDPQPPIYLSALLGVVRLLGRAPVSGSLRLAWDDRHEMRAALAKQDA